MPRVSPSSLPPQLEPAPGWDSLHQSHLSGSQKDHLNYSLTALPGPQSFSRGEAAHSILHSPLLPSPPHHYEQVKMPCAAALSSGRKDSPALHEVIPVQDFLAHVISLQPPWKLKACELTIQELGEKKSLEEGAKA